MGYTYETSDILTDMIAKRNIGVMCSDLLYASLIDLKIIDESLYMCDESDDWCIKAGSYE